MHGSVRANRRQRNATAHVEYGPLELRQVLNGIPIANPDPHFVTPLNTELVVPIATGVLANDFDAEGSTLTATKLTNPASGVVTFNGNGSFTYTPNTNFVGVDAFTYQISDATNNSVPTTVFIAVGQTFSYKLNADERGSNNLLHTGSLPVAIGISGTDQLVHLADTVTPYTYVPLETIYNGPPAGSSLTFLTAELTFNGTVTSTVSYNTGLSALASGTALRFSLRANNTNVLATGMYNWSIKLTATFSNSTTSNALFSGAQAVVNRKDSDFGTGWWLSDYDRLFPQTNGAVGALLVDSDGSSRWFSWNAGTSTYNLAEGDTTYATLVKTAQNTYVLTDKWGNTRSYDTSGFLTGVKRLSNNVNTRTYSYTSSKLTTITDEFGRNATLSYNGNGKLAAFTDHQGRIATMTYTDPANPNSPTLSTMADPLPPIPGNPSPGTPITNLTYLGGRLNTKVDPLGNTETYFHDGVGVLTKIQHADTSEWQLFPSRKEGYKSISSGNTVFKVSDKNARFIDERVKTFKFETDRFGNVIRFTDALNAVSNWEYSPNNLLYRTTAAAPDVGGAPATRPVTKYGYNGKGSLLKLVNPDNTTLAYTVHGTLQLPLTQTNELGKVDTYTYSADGDLLTSKDANNNTWTFTYDVHGYTLTETSPDPDGGGGPLQSLVTAYEYETVVYKNLKKITHPDTSTRQFTYDVNDNRLTETDELNRVTSFVFDNLDRLTTVTLPAVAGGTAIYRYEYNKNGQVSKVTDPLNNATDYVYNNRTWLEQVQQPDPDGFGLLGRPQTTYTYFATGQVATLKDPKYVGAAIQSFTLDDNGQLTQVSGPTPGEIYTTTFDLLGRTKATSDVSGRIMNYQYDIRSRLTKMIDHDPDGAGPQLGPTTTYTYDNASRMTSVKDPLARTTVYAFADNGWLNSLTMPDPDLTGPLTSPVYAYTYDAVGRRTQVTDPLSRITKIDYDSRDRIVKVTSPIAGIFSTYAWDNASRLTSTTDPLGLTTLYVTDNLDRLQSVTLPDPDGVGVGQTASTYSYSYDLVGNMINSTDPLGRVTGYVYDSLYRPTTVTQPDPDGTGTQLSPVWTSAYGANTILLSQTDPLGRITTLAYDDAGRQTSMTEPLSRTTTWSWDNLNRMVSETSPDPDGVGVGVTASTTTFGYDILSRLTSVMDPLTKTTQYAYDVAGQLISLTDSVGNNSQWSYDRLGQTKIETNGAGTSRSHDYDAAGNLTRSTDRNGRWVNYVRDNLDRMVEENWRSVAGSEPLVTVTTEVAGGGGFNERQLVQVTYLLAGNLGTFTLAFNGETTRPIPSNSNSATVKSALEELEGIDLVTVDPVTFSGGMQNYRVTFLGTLANQNVASIQGAVKLDAAGTSQRQILSTYDNASRLTSVTDPTATYQYTLDNLGRVTAELQNLSGSGLVPNVLLKRTWDKASNRTGLAADLIVGATTTPDFNNAYSFDGLDRVGQIIQSAQGGVGAHVVTGKKVSFSYNALGQFTYISRYQNTAGTGADLRSVLTYDNANRLSTLFQRNILSGFPNVDLASYTLTYDAMDRLTTVNSLLDGISNFTYDKRSQLLIADHAAPRPDENYTLDDNGNRTGGGNTTGTDNKTTSDGTYNYLYDREGNRTRRTLISTGSYEEYTWDHRNRLTGVTFKNSANVVQQTIDYRYDAFNRMVKRSHDTNGPTAGGVIDQYFAGFDGIDATLQFDGPNVSDVSHRMLWGPGVDMLMADEQVITPTQAGNVLWPLGDWQGTLRDVVDFNETTSVFEVANHRVYDSFGNLTSETNTNVNLDFGYTGKFYDETTKLSHHWNRWFDPKAGKWTSQDPIGFLAGDTNLSRYVGNGSTNRIDPSGLDWLDDYANWYEEKFGRGGRIATNVAGGIVIGGATVAVVVAAAPVAVGGLVAVGVSTATATTVVTTSVVVVGAVGTVAIGVDAVDAGMNGDWERVGLDAGLVVGGGIVGKAMPIRFPSTTPLPIINPNFVPKPGIGTNANLPPNIGNMVNVGRPIKGVWPAIMKDGIVYVDRFHIFANRRANGGVIGREDAYGSATLNEFGEVIGVSW